MSIQKNEYSSNPPPDSPLHAEIAHFGFVYLIFSFRLD